MAATAASMEPCAVSRMNAISRGVWETRSSNSKPSMRGILRSVTTMPGLHERIFSSASRPSQAVWVQYPQAAASSASPERSFSSSSTISTFSDSIPIQSLRWSRAVTGIRKTRRPRDECRVYADIGAALPILMETSGTVPAHRSSLPKNGRRIENAKKDIQTELK